MKKISEMSHDDQSCEEFVQFLFEHEGRKIKLDHIKREKESFTIFVFGENTEGKIVTRFWITVHHDGGIGFMFDTDYFEPFSIVKKLTELGYEPDN